MKRELTIEQSKKLLELGLNPDKASKRVALGTQPIFDLADLLNVLPRSLVFGDGTDVCLHIQTWPVNTYAVNYHVTGSRINIISVCAEEFIDAVYEAIVELMEGEYL